jgi:hypothetical protein
MLEMLMIEPRPCSFIRLPTKAMRRKGPLRLISMVLSNSASVCSARLGETGAMPALFTRMSIGPTSFSMRSRTASIAYQ